ncbi:hypothetical protein KJ596_01155 [Patescibacteria group bacterium]|nr:hypothetical protein [Patescibacteria group bacterium]MBU1868127.1 hypothetical protein [Patescibacteria group bacterium]
MTSIQQALIIFAAIQIVFGYYEYKAKPDIITVFIKLFQPKYLFTSLSIALFYILVVPLFRKFLTWFFRV